MSSFKTIFTNKNLFLFGLVLIVVGMPLSRFFMSLGQFVLLGNWILEGEFKRKGQIIKTSKVLWVLCSFYLLHLIGLFYTTDFNYALNDLRIKLPLLWFPLLFATSMPLEKKEMDALINIFIASVFTASIVSIVVLLGYTKRKVVDIRDISIFNSHIRFALMIVLSICALLHDYLQTKKIIHFILKAALISWFIVFLCIMESLTGLVILSIVSLYLVSKNIKNNTHFLLRYSPIILYAGVAAFMLFLMKDEWNKFYNKNTTTITANFLDEKTANGNFYMHDTLLKSTENGNYVWYYCNYDEMKPVWNRRSKINFDSLDHKGNMVGFTLIRYLTSKGLKKDSLALASLQDDEIQKVEAGVSNYLYANTGSIRSRIHEVIWEYDNFINNSNPSGNSVFMRLEFWKTGLQIWKQHPLTGVGTGDVQRAYNNQYILSNSKLSKKWQLRSHNQFIAILVSFGSIGLIVFIVWLIYPAVAIKKKHALFYLFFIIALLSMLNEDTLETQAGVTFFGFFYALFLYNPSGTSAPSAKE